METWKPIPGIEYYQASLEDIRARYASGEIGKLLASYGFVDHQ
jgi:hypothetical protein